MPDGSGVRKSHPLPPLASNETEVLRMRKLILPIVAAAALALPASGLAWGNGGHHHSRHHHHSGSAAADTFTGKTCS
jgi:hypothetical protein